MQLHSREDNILADNSKRSADALNKLDRELKSRDMKEKTRPLGVVALSLISILAIVGSIWFFATRDGSKEDITAQEASASSAAPSTPELPDAPALTGKRAKALDETVTCEYSAEAGAKAAKDVKTPNGKDVSAEGTVNVTFTTNQGDIEMKLDRALAPCTVNAITDMVKQGYYNDTVCHRMTSGVLNVLQCGDPSGTGSGGPGFQYKNEYPTDEVSQAELNNPVTYPKGSIAMANAGADTNGSQFFLNYDTSMLAPNYTYFGNVTEAGMKTLDKIAAAGVEGGASDGAPAQEVKIEKATVKS